MGRVDVYSLQIISQYFVFEEDFVNIIQVNSKYRNVLDRMRINPIQITETSKKLFKFIETQQLFSKYDLLKENIERLQINYEIEYNKYLEENEKGNKCKKVVYTEGDRKNYGCLIPHGVNIIGVNCFCECNVDSFTIPSFITEIKEAAFIGNQNINEIRIPNVIEKMGSGIFFYCGNLTNVILPNNLKVISSGMFCGCVKLRNIDIPSSVSLIKQSAFEKCGLTEIIINSNIRNIGNKCFRKCRILKKVVLNGLKILEQMLFCYCDGLKTIIMDNSVKKLGSGCFKNCYKLVNIQLSSNLRKIGMNCFENCTSLERIVIPKSVIEIDGNCFTDCKHLRELNIENNDCIINNPIIEDCTSLTLIKIPLINGCCTWNVSEKEESILQRNGISINIKKNLNIEFIDKKGLISVETPNLSEVLFQQIYTNDKITSIFIPSTVTRLDDYCFSNFHSLKELYIPPSVVNIGNYILYKNKLTKLTIANSSLQKQPKVSYDEYVLFKQNGIDLKKSIIRWDYHGTNLPSDCFISIDFANEVMELEEIPLNVVSIKDFGFLRKDLTSLTVPSNQGLPKF